MNTRSTALFHAPATALALSLLLAPTSAAQAVSCDQGPVFSCGPAGATALPPQTEVLDSSAFPFQGSLFLDRYSGNQPLAGAVFTIELTAGGVVEYTNNTSANCPLTTWQTTTSLDLGSPSHPALCPATLPLHLDLHRSGSFSNVPSGATVSETLTPDGYCGACPIGPALQIGPLTDPALLADLTGPGQVEFELAASAAFQLLGCTPSTSSFTPDAELRVSVQYFVCATACYGGDFTACEPAGTVVLPPQSDEILLSVLPAPGSLLLERYHGGQPLVAAYLDIEVTTTGTVDFMNAGAAPCPLVTWQVDSLLDLSSPTHPALCPATLPLQWDHVRTGTFTDVPPGGTVSATLLPDGLCSGCPTGTPIHVGPLLDPALLSDLSGPGQVQFDLFAGGSASVFGCNPSNFSWTSDMLVRVTLQYVVCAEPGTPLCFGDGSGAPCGCANDGAPGEGCANSTGVGSVLSGSGLASLSADSLVLEAVATPDLPGSFFQGDALLPNPLTFGDGLRCCGVNVLRITVVGAQGNCASTDQPVGCGVQLGGLGGPISQLPGNSGLQPGDSRCYQWWYRDNGPSNPCNGDLFNLSNAYVVTWGP